MAPLPIAKLASLLIKTLAKPMSKKVKLEFSRYETTQNILVAIGQSTHSLTSRMKIWSEGYVVRSIKPLDRETAMTGGSEFVGEAFLFSVAGGLVVWEYNKKSRRGHGKESEGSSGDATCGGTNKSVGGTHEDNYRAFREGFSAKQYGAHT